MFSKKAQDMSTDELNRAGRKASKEANAAILERDRLVRRGASDALVEAAVKQVTAVITKHNDVLHEYTRRGDR